MPPVGVVADVDGGPGTGTSNCCCCCCAVVVVVVVVALLGDISSCACTGVGVVDCCSGGADVVAASAESRSMLVGSTPVQRLFKLSYVWFGEGSR